MSAKTKRVKPKIDKRIQRSRDALGDALIALMQEKPFESITVQQVLDRAEVARSTFYTHFKDKDDLFLSDADDFWERMANCLSLAKDPSNRIAPVREFFDHIKHAQKFLAALTASGHYHETMELGLRHIARAIEKRLAEVPLGAAVNPEDRPALAYAHAGSMFSLMRWWMDRGLRESPDEMDDTFHRIVWGAAWRSSSEKAPTRNG